MYVDVYMHVKYCMCAKVESYSYVVTYMYMYALALYTNFLLFLLSKHCTITWKPFMLYYYLQMTAFHGVNLRDNELEFFKQRNLSIAHCPNSNLK